MWLAHASTLFDASPKKSIPNYSKFRPANIDLDNHSLHDEPSTSRQRHIDKMATELTVQSERAFQKQPHSKFGSVQHFRSGLSRRRQR